MKLAAPLKALLLVVPVLALVAADDAPPPPLRTTWDGVFTAEQVERGRVAYLADCRKCHGEKLEGNRDEEAPAMVGKEFLEGWYGKPVGRMVDVTRRTMPPETPGTMSRAKTLDLVAYLLSENGFPAGNTPLPTGAAELREIMIEPKPDSAAPTKAP